MKQRMHRRPDTVCNHWASTFPFHPYLSHSPTHFPPSRILHIRVRYAHIRRITARSLNYELIKKVDVSRGDDPRIISSGYSDVISISRYDECQNEISVEIALKLELIVEQIGVCYWRRLANCETDRKKDFVRRIL